MLNNIIEVIDSILPQDQITITFLEFPFEGDCLFIEETTIRGKITNFKGFDGLTTSNIQLFVRKKAKSNAYVGIITMLKGFFKLLKANEGKTFDNYEILYVDEFTISAPYKNKDGNYIISMDFPLIYKERERE
jgi:hypothetical protein